MKKVTIYSDGGCHGNPGPGAWAAILQYGKHVREITGGTAATTNNRMELMAAIESLNMLKEACDIDIHTDSEYVRNGITQWLAGWKRNGWRTAAKKPVKNADLWQQLDTANARHQVRWHWVKGHAGNDLNERCDELVQQAIAKVKEKHGELGLAEALKAFKAAEG
jgi:ribonuclease HI